MLMLLPRSDMYYTAPVLFGSQRFVNDGVVRIANLFGVSRDLLGVVRSAKGSGQRRWLTRP